MTAESKQATARARLMRALAHPLRQRILLSLNEGEASPSQLAQQLDQPLQNVAYHVNILLANDAVELVRTAPVRGAIEHFYRPTSRAEIDDEHWSELPVSVRRALFDKTIDEIWKNVAAAAASGGLDDPQAHISWVNLDLDEETYQQVVALLAETLERAIELQAEAAHRRAEAREDAEETHPTQLTILHFDRPPQPPPRPAIRKPKKR